MEIMCHVLKEMGILEHLIAIIKIIYANNREFIRMESDFPESL